MGGACCSAARSSGPRTGASTSSPPRTSAARCSTCGSASTTTGRLLGLDVRILHDNGAYTPYGIIVPIITSTQLLGPYKLGRLPGGVHRRLHQHRASSRPTAARAARRACSAWSGRWTASPTTWARTARQVREANFIQPDEFPYDQGLIFQDGRPLIYDSGDYPELLRMRQGADRLGRLRGEAPRRGRGPPHRHRARLLRRGHRRRPVRGRARRRSTSDGRVHVSTGLTSQGQGHQTVFAQIAADRARRADRAACSVVTGDTRRFGYAVGTFASRAAVMSGNAIALACRQGAGEGAAHRRRRAGGRPGATWRSSTGVVHVAGVAGGLDPAGARSRCCPTRCGTPSTRRRPAATQFAGAASPDRPPVAEGEEPGLEGRDYYSPIRSTFAAGMHAAIVETDPRHRRDHGSCATPSCTTAAG